MIRSLCYNFIFRNGVLDLAGFDGEVDDKET